jgi:hypothetical protein
MTSRRVAFLLLVTGGVAACVPDHGAGLTEVAQDDCVACHLSDYEGAANPVHAGAFPTTCADCHRTDAWRPALGGVHPEAAFPIQSGPHEGIRCLDCHNADLGPSTDGQNTDCTACHTRGEMDDTHDEEPGYQWDPMNHHFCLSCHPRGLKDDD